MTLVRLSFLILCTLAAGILSATAFLTPAGANVSITKDRTFGTGGTVAVEWARSETLRIAVDSSRRIYVGGPGNQVHRFKRRGAIDLSWGEDGVSPYRNLGDFNYPGEVDLLPGNGLLMPSMTDSSNSEVFDHGYEVVKLGPDGMPDRRFGKRGLIGHRAWYRTQTATATAMRSDGKIYLTGGKDNLEPSARARLMLLRPDGSKVERFGKSGAFHLSAKAHDFGRKDNVLTEFTDVVALPDGDGLVSGVMGNRVIFTRVDPSGEQVRSFGGRDGILTVRYGSLRGIGSASYFGNDAEMKMHASPDSRWFYLLARGNGQRNKVISFDRHGRLNMGFGEDGVAAFGRRNGQDWKFLGTSLEVLPDGRLVIAGKPSWGHKNRSGVLTLLNRNGSVDQKFGTSGYLSTEESGLKGIIDIEWDRRGGLIVVGDPVSYVEPPPYDPYEGPAEPTYAWLSRFVIR